MKLFKLINNLNNYNFKYIFFYLIYDNKNNSNLLNKFLYKKIRLNSNL